MEQLAATPVTRAEVVLGKLLPYLAIGMIDVGSVFLPDLAFQPTMHVHYGEKVLAMRDGLPKFKDFPKEFGGSGDKLPE